MEKINQLFSSVKDRLANPLVFSFLLSWLAFNWEVVIAILWYDSPKNIENNISLIEYIYTHTYSTTSFWFPLLVAIGYTFIMPFILSGISAAQAFATKIGEDWSLSILKDSKISVDKYLSLRQDYKKRSEELAQLIADESSTLNTLSVAQSDLRHLQSEYSKIMTDFNEGQRVIATYQNKSLIDGKWFVTAGQRSMNIRVVSGIVMDAHNGEHLYRIENFFLDSKSERVSFMLVNHESRQPQVQFYSFNDLRFQHNEMMGREYKGSSTLEITYKRPSDLPLQE